MVLTYTSKTISILEKSMGGKNVELIVKEGGVTNIVALVQTGVGCSTNEAFDLVDEYRKTSDTEHLMYDIMRALQEQGFLSKELPLEKLQAVATTYYKDLAQALDTNDTVKAQTLTQEVQNQVAQTKLTK